MSEQNNNGENQNKNQLDNLTEDQIKEIEESEEYLLNFKDEDLADESKHDELKKHLARARTTVHQKRHFRDRAKELGDKLKEAAGEKDTGKGKGDEGKGGDNSAIAIVQFRQDHPELPKDVAAEVVDMAKTFGISPEDALKKPMVQAYIEKELRKGMVEDSSAPASRGAASTIQKRDWSTASQADIDKQRAEIMAQG